MIFSKILQCFIFVNILFCAISPSIAASESNSKTDKVTKTDKTEKKPSPSDAKVISKDNAAEINLTGSNKGSIEEQIKEQLKKLNMPLNSQTQKKNSFLIPQLAKVEIKKQQKNLAVDIKSEEEISSVASFVQDQIWYVVLSGVTDVEIAPYEDDVFPQLLDIGVLKAGTGEAILKIALNVRQTPKVTQTIKGVNLYFEAKDQTTNCDDLIELPRNPLDQYCVRTRFADDIVEFDDPTTNRSFWVLTSEKPFREINEHKYPEFTLLPSLMGLAFDVESEDLEIDYRRRKVCLSLASGLSVSSRLINEKNAKAQSIFEGFNVKSAPDRIQALYRLTSRENNEILQKNIELIWQYLGLGKVPEAHSLVNLLHESYPDIALMPTFRALNGVTQLLLNRAGKATELLDVLTYDPEPKFWYCLAKVSKNEFIDTDSLHDLAHYKKYYQLLPLALQSHFQTLILQAAVLHHEINVLQVYADAKFYPSDIFVEQLFKLATAIIILDQGKKTKAIQQLTSLSQNLISKRVATLAAFELIKLEEKEKTIQPTDNLSKLNQLRFSWRGDLLEYSIARHYVTQLTDNKFYAKTLPIFRSLIKYFPDQANHDKLPELMQKNLMMFFDQKPEPSLMESLSIFQEFGDLAPNSADGDKIILKATGKLVRLDLYHDALDVLKKYTDKIFKDKDIDSKRKEMLLYKMAVVELLGKDAKECLKTLAQIETISNEMSDDITILKAEALNQTNEFDTAIASLRDTPLQAEKKGELYFSKERWEEAAASYQKALDLVGEKDKKIQADCVANLALCYALQNDKDKLLMLKETYSSLMDDSKHKNMFKFLTTDTTFSGALTSTEFGKIDSFAETLKKVFNEKEKISSS